MTAIHEWLEERAHSDEVFYLELYRLHSDAGAFLTHFEDEASDARLPDELRVALLVLAGHEIVVQTDHLPEIQP